MSIDRTALARMADGEGAEFVPVTRRWLKQVLAELSDADVARRGDRRHRKGVATA
jgi:hypothetical protein